jgi:hypothetical protein
VIEMATIPTKWYKRINGVSCVNYGNVHRDKATATEIAKKLRADNKNMKVHVVKETKGSGAGQYQIYVGADK